MFAGKQSSINLRLDHDVVASLLPQRSRLTVSRDTCVDDARIDLRDALVVHAVLLERIWEVVLDQYIAFLDELMQDADAGLVLE